MYWDATNELWGVSRYDDIEFIEKHADLFVNSDQNKGGYRPNIPADPAIIGLDDPEHRTRRNLVARRFTPEAVGELGGRGPGHRDAGCSTASRRTAGRPRSSATSPRPCPPMMIGKLLGFDADAWPDLQSWSERTIMLGGGPRYHVEDGIIAAMEFAQASADLHAEKSRCPADDVMTVWTQAEIDGCPMGVDPTIADSLLLLDGGAETTRTVIARALLTFVRFPDQWELLRSGIDLEIATEELIRFVTPIHNMCRVATEDVELGGGDGQGRRPDRAHVLVGQPRSRALHRPRAPRPHPLPEPPPRVRVRHPLLPRRVARPARDPALPRGAVRAGARAAARPGLGRGDAELVRVRPARRPAWSSTSST